MHRSARPLAALVGLMVLVVPSACTSPGSTTGSTTGGAPSASPDPVVPAIGAGVPTTGQRPNILLIEADDMRADELRWMPLTRARLLGDTQTGTDTDTGSQTSSDAGEGSGGLNWQSSFAPNPLCCPSRASMLTGRYSHNHGVLSHVDPYGFRSFDDSETLATALQAVGYQTGLVGKYLNGYGEQPTRDGAESLTYVPPGWTAWRGLSDHLWGSGDDFTGGTYDYRNPVENIDGEVKGFPDTWSTELTGAQTRALIRRFAAPGDAAPSEAAQPWFVWWTPIAPHHGTPIEDDDPGLVERSDGFETDYVTPARPDRVKGRFDDEITHGAGTPATGSAEADRTDKPRYLRQLPELTDEERVAQTTLTRQRAEALSVLDEQVVKTLDQLDAQGLADDTLVVFTSDNGYYLGEHLKRQGKINLHEPSIRVPLVIRGPGVPPGERYDPITTIDVAVTLAGYAGATLPAVDGLDLRDVVTGGDQGWDRPVVLEGLMPEARYASAVATSGWDSKLDTVGVRTGRYKLVRYPTGEIELYDLLTDPLELDSLGRDEGDPHVRREMKRLWRQVSRCAQDACRAELPPDLRTDPDSLRAGVQSQQRATEDYFGN